MVLTPNMMFVCFMNYERGFVEIPGSLLCSPRNLRIVIVFLNMRNTFYSEESSYLELHGMYYINVCAETAFKNRMS